MMLIFLLILFLLVAIIYIFYRLKIYFFFYNHQKNMDIMKRFLTGRALSNTDFCNLYLIPQPYLYQKIEKYFSRLIPCKEAANFLLHSGFLYHYLGQRKLKNNIVFILWKSHPELVGNYLRETFFLLAYQSQKTILTVLYSLDKDLFLDLFYIFIGQYPNDALIDNLTYELKADFTFKHLQQKKLLTDFNFVFFYFYPNLNRQN